MKPFQQSGRIYGPSPLHQWQYVSVHVSRCVRCGSHFHDVADVTAGPWCPPTPAWLAAHPGDEEQR